MEEHKLIKSVLMSAMLAGGVHNVSQQSERMQPVARGAVFAPHAVQSAVEAIHDPHMTQVEFRKLIDRTRAAVRLEMRNHCSLDGGRLS